jgi:drug/metabolite transporter (DMT)-like permease
MAARGHLKFKADKLHFHLLRSGSGISNMYLYFFCLGVLPLGETILLFQTAPIWIPFIAAFWLGEPFKKRYIFSAIIGFIGVAFIVRPDDGDFSLLVLLALGGAFLSALNKCTIRRMADTESPYQVVLYFTLFSTLISIFPLFWQWQTPLLIQWPLLFLMGLMAAVGQLLMTRAFMSVTPGAIGALGYTQVVFAFTLGWLFWNETLQWNSLLGTVMIIVAGLIAMGVFVRKSAVKSLI